MAHTHTQVEVTWKSLSQHHSLPIDQRDNCVTQLSITMKNTNITLKQERFIWAHHCIHDNWSSLVWGLVILYIIVGNVWRVGQSLANDHKLFLVVWLFLVFFKKISEHFVFPIKVSDQRE